MRFPVAVLLLVVLATSSVRADEGPAADLKLSRSFAKKLVKQWLTGKPATRERARAKLLRTRPEDRARIVEALEAGTFFPDRKHAKLPREQTLTIAFSGGTQPSGEVVVQLPDSYTGEEPWPVLFRLHGSGDRGANYAQGWRATPSSRSFISVTPTVPTRDRMGWRVGGVKNFFDAVYRHVIAHYNVDTDRCYLSGYSAGGGAAFFYAQTWPHRCAGFFARGRLWWNHNENPDPCTAVLRHVPGYFLCGLADQADRVQGFQRTKAFYEKHGFPGVFHLVPGRKHEYMPEYDAKVFPELLKKRRVKHPKAFTGYYFTYGNVPEERPHNLEQYWMRVVEHDRRGAKCTVSVEGNTVAIVAEGIKEARLHLADGIVNLDEPVIVTFNGTKLFEGKVERSVPFLLKWFEEHRDPRRLFWNEIPVRP